MTDFFLEDTPIYLPCGGCGQRHSSDVPCAAIDVERYQLGRPYEEAPQRPPEPQHGTVTFPCMPLDPVQVVIGRDMIRGVCTAVSMSAYSAMQVRVQWMSSNNTVADEWFSAAMVRRDGQ